MNILFDADAFSKGLHDAGEGNHRKAHEAMLVLREHFEERSSFDKLAFIDAIETGTPACDSTYNEIAAPLRAINDGWTQFIRSFHGEPFRLFLLDYYPKILALSEFSEARRFYEMKLERSPAYLKHRSLPTARQWVEAGFHLFSDNPADYFLMRWRLIDDFSSEQCAQPKAMADAILAVAEANSLQVEQDAGRLKDLVGRISAEIGAPVVYVSQDGPGRAAVHPRLLEELKKPGNERLLDIARYW